MEMLDKIVNKIIGWIDSLFGWFGFYSMKASKGLVAILALFVLGGFFKLNVKVGHKK